MTSAPGSARPTTSSTSRRSSSSAAGRPPSDAPVTRAVGHVVDGLVDGLATLNVPQVEAAPEDAAVADAEDGDPAHVEAGAVAAGAVPVPLAPSRCRPDGPSA